MNTKTIDEITYIVCASQDDVDRHQGEEANLLIDAGSLCIRITIAKNVRVVSCGDMNATHATIGHSLNATHATIEGGLYATHATIGYSLNASDATIGGGLYARGATIGGVHIGAPTDLEKATIRDILALGDRLNMSCWHGPGWRSDDLDSCGTTCCIAGFLQERSQDMSDRTGDPDKLVARDLPSCYHLIYTTNDIATKAMRAMLAE